MLLLDREALTPSADGAELVAGSRLVSHRVAFSACAYFMQSILKVFYGQGCSRLQPLVWRWVWCLARPPSTTSMVLLAPESICLSFIPA